MAYIHNNKYKEIYEASKGGNEKALMVIQALRKNQNQADLDRLVEDYYGVSTISQGTLETPKNIDFEPQNIIQNQNEETTSIVPNGTTQDSSVFDLTKVLDDELDGLIDENDVDDLSFGDFLKNKSRDALRAKKGVDYFKAYDPTGRNEYMINRINNYKTKFDGRLKDIERRYNDVGQSMSYYSQGVNDMLDDNVELDMEKVTSAYNDFTTDEETMGSFGRHWDEGDNSIIIAKLQGLVAKYGKQNVLSALNTISSDNENYRSFLNNQIDSEVSRYTKSIENILK